MDELTNKQPEESLEQQMAALEAANERQAREALAEQAEDAADNMVEEPAPMDAEAAVAAGVAADTVEAEPADKPGNTPGLSAGEKAEVAGLDRDALVARLEKLHGEGLSAASRELVALLRATYQEKTEAWKTQQKQRQAEAAAAEEATPAEGAEAAGTEAAQYPLTDELEERFFKVSRLIKEQHAKEREARERLMA
ncbi:MAG: hypothetical protein K2G46_03255, partial [Bacteroidales bacterium]|nr:hypothetical protein [Bacteroidales bacterium]